MPQDKKLLILIPAIIIGILSYLFFTKLKDIYSLQNELERERGLVQQSKTEVQKLRDDNTYLKKENDNLQANAISSLSRQNSLQEEIDNLKKRLEEGSQEAKSANSGRDELLDTIEKYRKKESSYINKLKAQDLELNELPKIKKQLDEAQSALKRETGRYYYTLGLLYHHDKNLNKAFDAYQKAVSYNIEEPNLYYNLALLYEEYQYDPPKAIDNYKKYLKLSPKAADRQNIEASIKRLSP